MNNKISLDGIDKEILRVLCIRRPLVSSKIAKTVGLTSSAIKPRLINLQNLGILKEVNKSSVRIFEREYNGKRRKVESPCFIYWDLDLA